LNASSVLDSRNTSPASYLVSVITSLLISTVDHHLLATRHRFCAIILALARFSSYLSGCTKVVYFNNWVSIIIHGLRCAMRASFKPKDFIVYTVNIDTIIHRYGIHCHCFAGRMRHIIWMSPSHLLVKVLPRFIQNALPIVATRSECSEQGGNPVWVKDSRSRPDKALTSPVRISGPHESVRDLGPVSEGDTSVLSAETFAMDT